MSNNKEWDGEAKRTGVPSYDDYELQHIANQLNVSPEEARKAIEEVGYKLEDIEEYIRDRRNRS